MKYKFHSWEYIIASGITVAWAKEQDIVFNQKDDKGSYAILDEFQAIQVRLQDCTVNLTTIPE